MLQQSQGNISADSRDKWVTNTPLLLIHGFPFSSAMWDGQLFVFPDRRTIVPNLRGFGGADPYPGPPPLRRERADELHPQPSPSLDVYANDLIALLDQQGISRFIVGGLSMGGYIAFALLRRWPERIAGLILADTQPGADSQQARAKRAEGVEMVRTQGKAAFVESQLPRYFAPATHQHHPEIIAEVREMMLEASEEGIIFALLAMAARPDSSPMLRGISVPTLVLVGEQDVITPPAVAQAMAAQIPDAIIGVIPEAGHLSNMEQPELFNRYVATFLSKL